MYKKILIIIYTFVFIMSGLLVSGVRADSSLKIQRIWGSDRYITSSYVVEKGWESSNYAVLVNGENFPDALIASSLAKKFNAPILLTQSNSLSQNALFELNRLGTKDVFIVGGKAVISEDIEKYINMLGINTTRYSGIDRDETSVKVAGKIGTQNGIFIVSDDDFMDMISISPIAANLNMPIILVYNNEIPFSVQNFISDKYIPMTYVIGDKEVIGDSVLDRFPNVKRITGNDAYERNANIINAFSNKLDFSSIFLAYSKGFSNVLSATSLAAISGNPIVLVGDTISCNAKKVIRSNHIENLNVLASDTMISESTVNEFINLINGSD